MKRILEIILIIILAIMLFVCSSKDCDAANKMDGRFEVIKVQSGLKLIKDSHTNKMYLFAKDGYGGGLTVLLGADGKPYHCE